MLQFYTCALAPASTTWHLVISCAIAPSLGRFSSKAMPRALDSPVSVSLWPRFEHCWHCAPRSQSFTSVLSICPLLLVFQVDRNQNILNHPNCGLLHGRPGHTYVSLWKDILSKPCLWEPPEILQRNQETPIKCAQQGIPDLHTEEAKTCACDFGFNFSWNLSFSRYPLLSRDGTLYGRHEQFGGL